MHACMLALSQIQIAQMEDSQLVLTCQIASGTTFNPLPLQDKAIIQSLWAITTKGVLSSSCFSHPSSRHQGKLHMTPYNVWNVHGKGSSSNRTSGIRADKEPYFMFRVSDCSSLIADPR